MRRGARSTFHQVCLHAHRTLCSWSELGCPPALKKACFSAAFLLWLTAATAHVFGLTAATALVFLPQIRSRPFAPLRTRFANMSSSESKAAQPALIYRLCFAADYEAAVKAKEYAMKEIDVKDGYIHLSTMEEVRCPSECSATRFRSLVRGCVQAAITAKLYFKNAKGLMAMEFETAKLADKLKFEYVESRKVCA